MSEATRKNEGKAAQLKNSVRVNLNNIPLTGRPNSKIEGTGEYGLYYDKYGNLTGGVGHLVKDQKDAYRFLSGSKEAADKVYAEDLASHNAAADKVFKQYGINKSDLPSEVVEVVNDMAFNMGEGGLSQFKTMMKGIKEGDYEKASRSILNSKYATQVGDRAKRNAELIKSAKPQKQRQRQEQEQEQEQQPQVISEMMPPEQDTFQDLNTMPNQHPIASQLNKVEVKKDPEMVEFESEFQNILPSEVDEFETEFNNISQPQSSAPKYSLGETVARKATQGATLGFGDEIGGMFQSIISRLEGKNPNNPYKVDQKLAEQGFTGDLQTSPYDAGLKAEREKLDQMSEDRPYVSAAAEFAGGIPSGLTVSPVAAGALYGFGEGEGTGNRLAGAALGATLGELGDVAAPALAKYGSQGINYIGGKTAELAQDLKTPITRTFGSKFKQEIAPESRNIYTAITNHTKTEKTPVLEAITRQKDMFLGQDLRTNSVAAGKIVQQEMSDINQALSTMTRELSDQAQSSAEKPLVEAFSDLSDTLADAVNRRGSKKIKDLAQQVDTAILDGDYENLVNIYQNNIKSARRYAPDGTISYSGEAGGLLEDLDKLFMDKNDQFIDLMSDRAGLDEFRGSMSKLKDLHILDDHLHRSNSVTRNTLPSLQDSIAGGAVGGMVGSTLGGPGMGLAMAAGPFVASAMRQSIVRNNLTAAVRSAVGNGRITATNAARSTISRSLEGAIEAAQKFGPELIESGVPQESVQQLLRMANREFIDMYDGEKAALRVINSIPEIFEDSSYASEVGGRITDPMEVEKERARITRATEGNIRERAKALSNLNKNGAVYRPQAAPTNLRELAPGREVNRAQEIEQLFKEFDAEESSR